MINDSVINCNDSETMCIQGAPWIITPQVIWPEIRLGLIKSEIMKNLPRKKQALKIYIFIFDLEIYIEDFILIVVIVNLHFVFIKV